MLSTTLISGFLVELPPLTNGDQRYDGADRLLLETFAAHFIEKTPIESAGPGGNHRVLIMNDRAGALVCVLSSPSFRVACGLELNQLESFGDDIQSFDESARLCPEQPMIGYIASTETPNPPTIVIMRVSPIVGILRAQIMLLMEMRDRGERFMVIAAGFDRMLPAKTKAILTMLGPTDTMPGAHKCHAFVCRAEAVSSQSSLRTKSPESNLMGVEVAGRSLEFETGPYAFSAGRLDEGARLLIEAVAASKSFGRTDDGQPGHVADLACGNGVVGILAHLAHSLRSLYFSDSSFSAVALAERNAQRHGIENAEFVVDNGFGRYTGPRFDAMLVNPPFHHHGGVDEELGAQLFVAAHGQLRVGGELWAVGNRHLGYQKTLQMMFGHCRLVTAHPKFVVLVARRNANRLRLDSAAESSKGNRNHAY